MQILTANDIYKSFDGVEVLKGISVGVNKGEVLAIIGPSGSGKSTFLRCVTQLETVDAGDITICGEKLVQNGADGKAQYADKAACGKIGLRIGLVFQNFNLFPHFSVLRNITEAPVRVLGKSKEEAGKAARQLLVKMNLADKADAYPFQLSGDASGQTFKAIAGLCCNGLLFLRIDNTEFLYYFKIRKSGRGWLR